MEKIFFGLFFIVFLVSLAVLFTFGKEGNLQCRTGSSAVECSHATRAAEQARGGSQLPAAIYPPRAYKDRCMRKSVGGWSACVNFAIFCRWLRKITKTESDGVKNEKNARNGCKREPNRAKRVPKSTKMRTLSSAGPKRKPKVSQRAPKGSQRVPKGSQREPKGDQK